MTELLKIKLLWPGRQVWLADYCHGAILSASGLFDDHDCAMLYAREARNLSAGCYHDGIAWIKWYGQLGNCDLPAIVSV